MIENCDLLYFPDELIFNVFVHKQVSIPVRTSRETSVALMGNKSEFQTPGSGLRIWTPVFGLQDLVVN